MRFGLFYEQQLPKPWTRGDEQRLFAEALEQAELADRLGFDVLWAAEHHFLPEYSHSSAPEMFLAAASQRTKRIRLGHGIIQATTNHPARVAERIATLDVLTNGRAEFGLGEGQGLVELEPFGVSHDDKRARFEDTVRATLPMLYRDEWSYEGEFVKFPTRSAVPRPVQQPHPPLWVACTKTRTIRDAGRWGMGVLGFAFASPERASIWVGAYYNELLQRAQPLTEYQVNPNIAVASYFMCADSDEIAEQRADGCTFFEFSLGQYSRKIMTSVEGSLWERYEESRRNNGAANPAELGLVGSPERLRSRLRKMQESHVDQVILLAQTGKTRHDDMCESLELFAREVMPEFHAADDEHQQWKANVLNGAIELDDPDEDQLAVDAERIPGPVQPRAPTAADKFVPGTSVCKGPAAQLSSGRMYMTGPGFRFREESFADAPIEVVFDTVTDHDSYAVWSSCDEAYLEVEGSPERNGFGSVRVLQDTTSVKDGVLAVKEITNHYWPPYMYGYRVLDQSVVRDHQGLCLLERAGDNQTKITWHMTSSPIDPDAAEVLRPQLAAGVKGLVADLAAESERRHKAQKG